MPGRDLCLLSLDGGGVRGLSSLQILKQLMEAIALEAGLEDAPKPCDYFDMIGGTSTGGILAIMLGRLKMDIDACINAYTEMSNSIFQKKHHRVNVRSGEVQGRFDTAELEQAVKTIIKRQGLDEDALLKDHPDAPCKIFVCATSKITSDTVHLTSYRRARGGSDRLRVTKIWEAARATSAASSFFDPIRIEIGGTGEEFVDGATGANNPIQELWNEAKDMWDPEPLESNLKCIVSIGTGIPSVEPFKTGLLEIGNTLVRMSTETERTAESFQRAHSALDDSNRYFRFNVQNGLEKIGLEDSSQKDTIVSVTQRYVEAQDTFKLMKRCASNLAEREIMKMLRYQLVQSDLKLSRLQYCTYFERDTGYSATFPNLKQRIAKAVSYLRLSQAMTMKKSIDAFLEKGSKELGSGSWNTQVLENGLTPKGRALCGAQGPVKVPPTTVQRLLTDCDIVGSGKTMIATAVVEAARDISLKLGMATVYFYCESEQRDMLKGSDLMASFIQQLLLYLEKIRKPYSQTIHDYIMKFFGTKRSQPDFDDLADIFLELFKHTPNTLYIIDGLDAFDEKEVEKVLDVVRRFFAGKIKPLGSRIIILSREQITRHLSVTRSVPGIAHISIIKEHTANDIRLYVETVIEDKTMHARELTDDDDLLEETKKRLTEGASGMFLWAYLQIEALWDECETDSDIRRTLANLPKDLEETYNRCLRRIASQSRFAPKVLRWVSYAIRPLRIEELREAVAFDLNDQVWHPDNRPDSTSVLRCCANLVVLDTTDQRVRFAHPSVQQYLDENCKERIPGYPISSKQGELDCGELCVAYLSFSNFGLQIEKSSDRKIPIKPQNIVDNLPGESFAAIAFKVSRLIAPTIRQQRSTIHLKIPEKQTLAPTSEDYKFLGYAIANWATQTKSITAQSTVWHRFYRLALSPNESWNVHPWIRGGRSRTSHLHGLFGWAVKERHMPLLQILFDSNSRRQSKYFYDLPLIGGDLPALHTASRLGFEDVVQRLLEVCAINKLDEQDYTAIHHAASKGHLEVVKLLLKTKGVIIDKVSKSGHTPLWLAASNGHEEISSLLIQKGAIVKEKERIKESSALMIAAKKGHEAVVRLLLLQGWPLDPYDEWGPMELSLAAAAGHEAVVRLFLERGAVPDSKDKEGRTALSLAAENGHEAVARLLLEWGAAPDPKDNAGRTALSWAAGNGCEAVVRLILEQDAALGSVENRGLSRRGAVVRLPDPDALLDAEDKEGRTGLLRAAENGHETVVRLFLKRSAVPGSIDSNGWTALSWAAENGHKALVLHLLERGVAPDFGDEWGRTALSLAAEEGHKAVVQLLLERGATLESQDQGGRTALSWAAEAGYEAMVRLLLERGAALDLKDNGERTALLWAVESGHETVVRLLLERGAALDSVDGKRRTALLLAAEKGHETVVRLLLERGAALDSVDGKRRTALLLAAENGHEAVARLLLEWGAAPDPKDNAGRTALSWAAGYGNEALAQILLEWGTTSDSKDNEGRTGLSWAAENGHEAVVRLLLDLGATLDMKDKEGWTALSRAAKKGHETVVRLFLKRSAVPDSIDSNGWTALSWAAENGHEALVLHLLERAVAPDFRDEWGRTALSLAAGKGHEAVVQLLLKWGARLDSKDNGGRMALSWAAGKGHEAVVQLLLKWGARLDSKDNAGRTALSRASEEGREAVVQLLLDGCATLDMKDKEGQTALSRAVERGHETVVRQFPKYCAVPGSIDNNGWTALSSAAENGNKALVLHLLERGVAPDSRDEWGRTVLSLAARKGHEAVVQLLLEQGATLDSEDNGGRTALSWAAEEGREAVVRLLLERGVAPDAKDNGRWTALWWAVTNGHEPVARILLERGAAPDFKDNGGRTALSWTAGLGRVNMVRLLLEWGAALDIMDNVGRTALWWARHYRHEAIVQLLESSMWKKK